MSNMLWDQNVHSLVHKSPQLVGSLSQMDPVHTAPSYWSKIRFNFYLYLLFILFFKRIDNLSNITFTDEETQLVSKGLKYNLHQKRNKWIQALSIEADTSINQLNPHDAF
jgi:hypothetical protein